MKIYLIFSRKLEQASNIPPLGIMSIAAVLRDNGYKSIQLFDMAFHSKAYIVEKCVKGKPDIIGMSSDSISFDNGMALLKKIQNKYEGATYILGGVHSTIFPKQSLFDTRAEIAVIGEGESTIVDVIKAIEKKQNYEDINGIAYIYKGQFILNEKRKPIENLDTIPFPARDLLPMEQYLKTPPDVPMLYPTITIFVSRGCKGNCIYCQPVARTLFGSKMRQKSVKRVIEEILLLKKHYKFNSLYFTDDEFLYNGRDWIENFCNTLIDKRLKLNWACQARVDQIDDDIAKLIKKSGCYALGVGVESGSHEILKYMRKGYKIPQIDRAFDICRRNKIITTCNFMVGTPGETYSTIQESIKMLRRIRPNLVRCSITTPTPGSDLYLRMASENRINITKLSEFDRWASYPIKLDNFSKEDLQSSIKKILRIFYKNLFSIIFNPARWIKEFYFFKILLHRYLYLFKEPVCFWKDILFYLNYFTHRKGR